MKRKGTRDKRARTRAPRGTKQGGRVPPPESEFWPVWCRGKLWTPEAA